MYKHSLLITIISLCLYLFISFYYSKGIIVFAEELKNDVSNFEVDSKIYTEDYEDDIKLVDEIGSIKGVEESNYKEETSGENVDMQEDNNFKVMIIFCFGLIAGLVVGNYITGFVK